MEAHGIAWRLRLHCSDVRASLNIENAYYEGDDCRADDPKKELEVCVFMPFVTLDMCTLSLLIWKIPLLCTVPQMFTRVVNLEKAKGSEVKWRFKALMVSRTSIVYN